MQDPHRLENKFLMFCCVIATNVFLLLITQGRDEDEVFDHYNMLAPIWAFLAIPLLYGIQRFARALLAPSQALGTLYIISFKMLGNDVWRVRD